MNLLACVKMTPYGYSSTKVIGYCCFFSFLEAKFFWLKVVFYSFLEKSFTVKRSILSFAWNIQWKMKFYVITFKTLNLYTLKIPNMSGLSQVMQLKKKLRNLKLYPGNTEQTQLIMKKRYLSLDTRGLISITANRIFLCRNCPLNIWYLKLYLNELSICCVESDTLVEIVDRSDTYSIQIRRNLIFSGAKTL